MAPAPDEGIGLAEFASSTLALRRIVLVESAAPDASATVDAFAARWTGLGGHVAVRLRFGSGLDASLRKAATSKPDGVLFAGTESDALAVRAAMARTGLASLQLLLTSSALGDARYAGRYVRASDAAGTFAAIGHPYQLRNDFAFNEGIGGATGVGPAWGDADVYACTQVVLEAIRRASATGGLTRASVLASATAPSATFDTIVGSIGFTAAGDLVTPRVTVYAAHPEYARWTPVQQLDITSP